MRDLLTPAPGIRTAPYALGASIGLALVFLAGCAAPRATTESTVLDPNVGQVEQATSRACDEDGLVYRYYAQKVGQHIAIKSYCETPEDPPVQSANGDVAEGPCPVDRCGQATTSARAPLAPALLSAVVDLAKLSQVKVGSQSRGLAGAHGATEESHQNAQVNETVRFQLSPGVTCISRLKLYSDQHDVTTEVDRALAADRKRRGVKAKPEFALEAMETGDVYLEQRLTPDGHRLILLAETAYDGNTVGELVNEQTMCLSASGPIRLGAVTQYGFAQAPGDAGMIQIFAFPVARPASEPSEEAP